MDILVKKIYHGKRLSNFKVYKSVYETVDEAYFAFESIWDNDFLCEQCRLYSLCKRVTMLDLCMVSTMLIL